MEATATLNRICQEVGVCESNSQGTRGNINPCKEAKIALERYGDDVKAGHSEAAQYWKGQGDAYSSVCLGEMPSDHELLLHFGIHEVGSPALIVDEATARATPCTCFRYRGRDLCWSRGAIGMLKQDEQAIYCVAGKTYKEQPKLKARYERFAEAAEEAHKKIEAMPKGKERLEVWLEAMGEELGKRGITV